MLNPFTALRDWYLARRFNAMCRETMFRDLCAAPRKCVPDHPPGVGLRTAGPLPAGAHERVSSAMNAASGYAEHAWRVAREFDCDRLEWDHGGITITVTAQANHEGRGA
jgi:hypothetical protein